MRTIKEKYRSIYGDDFVVFIEYLENDLKPYAELKFYDYKHCDKTANNIHTYIFTLSKPTLTDEELNRINSIINTYEEGSVTFGRILFDEIVVTIVGTD